MAESSLRACHPPHAVRRQEAEREGGNATCGQGMAFPQGPPKEESEGPCRHKQMRARIRPARPVQVETGFEVPICGPRAMSAYVQKWQEHLWRGGNMCSLILCQCRDCMRADDHTSFVYPSTSLKLKLFLHLQEPKSARLKEQDTCPSEEQNHQRSGSQGRGSIELIYIYIYITIYTSYAHNHQLYI